MIITEEEKTTDSKVCVLPLQDKFNWFEPHYIFSTINDILNAKLNEIIIYKKII